VYIVIGHSFSSEDVGKAKPVAWPLRCNRKRITFTSAVGCMIVSAREARRTAHEIRARFVITNLASTSSGNSRDADEKGEGTAGGKDGNLNLITRSDRRSINSKGDSAKRRETNRKGLVLPREIPAFFSPFRRFSGPDNLSGGSSTRFHNEQSYISRGHSLFSMVGATRLNRHFRRSASSLLLRRTIIRPIDRPFGLVERTFLIARKIIARAFSGFLATPPINEFTGQRCAPLTLARGNF